MVFILMMDRLKIASILQVSHPPGGEMIRGFQGLDAMKPMTSTVDLQYNVSSEGFKEDKRQGVIHR